MAPTNYYPVDDVTLLNVLKPAKQQTGESCKCPHCDYKTSRSDNLRRHVAAAHPEAATPVVHGIDEYDMDLCKDALLKEREHFCNIWSTAIAGKSDAWLDLNGNPQLELYVSWMFFCGPPENRCIYQIKGKTMKLVMRGGPVTGNCLEMSELILRTCVAMHNHFELKTLLIAHGSWKPIAMSKANRTRVTSVVRMHGATSVATTISQFKHDGSPKGVPSTLSQEETVELLLQSLSSLEQLSRACAEVLNVRHSSARWWVFLEGKWKVCGDPAPIVQDAIVGSGGTYGRLLRRGLRSLVHDRLLEMRRFHNPDFCPEKLDILQQLEPAGVLECLSSL